MKYLYQVVKSGINKLEMMMKNSDQRATMQYLSQESKMLNN